MNLYHFNLQKVSKNIKLHNTSSNVENIVHNLNEFIQRSGEYNITYKYYVSSYLYRKAFAFVINPLTLDNKMATEKIIVI